MELIAEQQQEWNPLMVYFLTYFFSGLSGIGSMIYLDERQRTFWTLSSTFIVFGAAGTSMGMFYYFKFGSKDHPLVSVLVGQLVGVRIIKFQVIGQIILRLFGERNGEKVAVDKIKME